MENIDEYIKNKNVSNDIKVTLINFANSLKGNYKTQKSIFESMKNKSSEELNFAKTELKNLQSKLVELNNNEQRINNNKNEYLEKKKKIDIQSKLVIDLESDLNKTKALLDKKLVSNNVYQEKRNALIKGKFNLKKLKEEINFVEGENFVNKHTVIKENLSNLNNLIELQKIKVREIQTKLDESVYKLNSFDENNKFNIINKLLEKEKEIDKLKATLTKAEKSIGYKSIKSPVNGVIQDIENNTVGGVVKPTQNLVTIVPENTPIVIEAIVNNKDIGYVRLGQKVRIKVDAYSFQKYGVVEGKIEKISPDAIQDKLNGLVYRVKISIKNPNIIVDGQKRSITSGMTVVAEIKTGKRKIIEFLLEPVVKYVGEAFQVR